MASSFVINIIFISKLLYYISIYQCIFGKYMSCRTWSITLIERQSIMRQPRYYRYMSDNYALKFTLNLIPQSKMIKD